MDEKTSKELIEQLKLINERLDMLVETIRTK